MRSVAADVWTVDAPQRFIGIEMGTRATLVRLPDGGLWVHSPVPLDGPLRREVEALGPVRFVVAPNLFHHLYVREWTHGWPGVRLFVARGLPRKRPDLGSAPEIDDAPGPWAPALQHTVVRGSKQFSEAVFLHAPSRTLITSDLLISVEGAPSLWAKLLYALDGLGRGPATGRFMRIALRGNRTAARSAIDQILTWDFERIVVAHGPIIEPAGPELLREAYAWLKAQ